MSSPYAHRDAMRQSSPGVVKQGRNMAGCGTCRIRKKACPGPGPDGCCSTCLHLRIECLQLYNQPVSCEFRRREVMDQIARWYRTRGTRPSDESLDLSRILKWLHVNRPTDAGHSGANRLPPIPTLTFRRPPDSPSSSSGPAFGTTQRATSLSRSSSSSGSPHHSPHAGAQHLEGRPDLTLLHVPVPPSKFASTGEKSSPHTNGHHQSLRQSDRHTLGAGQRSVSDPQASSLAARYRPHTPESPPTRTALRPSGPPAARPRPTISIAEYPLDVSVRTGPGPAEGFSDPNAFLSNWVGLDPYSTPLGLDMLAQDQPYEVTTPQDIGPPYWSNIIDIPGLAFENDPSNAFYNADLTGPPINAPWPGADYSYQTGPYPVVGADSSRWCPPNFPSREPSSKPSSIPQSTPHSATSPRILSLLTWDLPSR